MVEAVVITKIGYCGEVYIGKTLENQKQVQRMINPAARLVMGWKGKDQDYPTSKLMADTGWWNSTCMWIEQQVHSMWRFLHTEDLCHLAGVVSVDTTGEGGEGLAHVEINAGTTSERECPQRK